MCLVGAGKDAGLNSYSHSVRQWKQIQLQVLGKLLLQSSSVHWLCRPEAQSNKTTPETPIYKSYNVIIIAICNILTLLSLIGHLTIVAISYNQLPSCSQVIAWTRQQTVSQSVSDIRLERSFMKRAITDQWFVWYGVTDNWKNADRMSTIEVCTSGFRVHTIHDWDQSHQRFVTLHNYRNHPGPGLISTALSILHYL